MQSIAVTYTTVMYNLSYTATSHASVRRCAKTWSKTMVMMEQDDGDDVPHYDDE